jgi:hypothetical protein
VARACRRHRIPEAGTPKVALPCIKHTGTESGEGVQGDHTDRSDVIPPCQQSIRTRKHMVPEEGAQDEKEEHADPEQDRPAVHLLA